MVIVPDTVYARGGDVRSRIRSPTTMVRISSFCQRRRSGSTCLGRADGGRPLPQLASFRRLILADLLGTGSSATVAIDEQPAMQAWVDGLITMLDAAGSGSTSVFAMAESTLPAMLLAATHSDRVRSLILFSPFAYYIRTPDRPFAAPEAMAPRCSTASRRSWARAHWWTGWYPAGPVILPSDAGAHERTPRRGAGILQGRIRSVPAYRRPAGPAGDSGADVDLAPRGDLHVKRGHAEYIAERITSAQLVELDGDDHWFEATATGCSTRSSRS